jgi:hypothetical protein
MSSKTLHHPIAYELELHDTTGAAIAVQAVDLTVDTLDGRIIRCFLTFRVSPAIYQQIDTHALFNLTPEVRGQIFGGQLQPDADVEIEAKLDPAYIFSLSTQVASVEALAEYLPTIREGQPNDALLDTESWFALYVKQSVALPAEFGEGQLKIGYRTTWADE